MSVTEKDALVGGITLDDDILMADSGAMKSVGKVGSFIDVALCPHKSAPRLHSITGEPLCCHGVKEVEAGIGKKASLRVDLTMADVSRSVLSLPEVADQGFTIVLSRGKSYITTESPTLPPEDMREELVRHHGVWFLRAKRQSVIAANSTAASSSTAQPDVATESGTTDMASKYTPREWLEMQTMQKEDKAVYEVPDNSEHFDAEFLHTTREDRKAWTYRGARRKDSFTNRTIVRRVTWCGRTGVVLEDLHAADTEGTGEEGWHKRLPAPTPRHIFTKIWHQRRERPIEVVRRDTPTVETSPGLPVPPSMTMDEMEEHCLTHCPYHAGCQHCVLGRARGNLHRRRIPEEPEVEVDWSYWSSADHVAEEEVAGALPSLTAVHRQSGMTLATAAPNKRRHPFVEDLLTRWLLMLGLSCVKFRLDSEQVSKGFARAMEQRLRTSGVQVLPTEFTTRASHQSIGGAERAHALVGDFMRTLLSQLRTHTQWTPPVTHPVFAWMIRHSGYLRSHHQQGADGLSPAVRRMGKASQKRLALYGESVLAQLGSDQRGKLADRWVHAVWVGVQESLSTQSEQYIVLTGQGALLSRCVKRLAIEHRWNAGRLGESCGLPWSPKASKVEHLSHMRPAVVSVLMAPSALSQGASASSATAAASSTAIPSIAPSKAEIAPTSETPENEAHEPTWLATPTEQQVRQGPLQLGENDEVIPVPATATGGMSDATMRLAETPVTTEATDGQGSKRARLNAVLHEVCDCVDIDALDRFLQQEVHCSTPSDGLVAALEELGSFLCQDK
eukprot:6490768-Amphidinium_carterae.1